MGSPTTSAVWNRRAFLVRATCATCVSGLLPTALLGRLSAQTTGGKLEGIRNLSLKEIQTIFHAPTHLSAYEYFTAGRGLGSAELVGAPKSVRVGQVVPKLTVRYRAPKEGIRPADIFGSGCRTEPTSRSSGREIRRQKSKSPWGA